MSLGICLSGQCFCVRSKGFWKWCLCRKGRSWDIFSLGTLQCREAELRMLIVFFPNSSTCVTIKVTQPSYKYENHINRLSYWVGKRIQSPNDLDSYPLLSCNSVKNFGIYLLCMSTIPSEKIWVFFFLYFFPLCILLMNFTSLGNPLKCLDCYPGELSLPFIDRARAALARGV